MKYKLKEIAPKIFAVIVPDRYDRAMLFCRVQEFYESAGVKFKDSKFSVWDYFKWYSNKYKTGCFSYPKDFVGFNLPLIVAKKCYSMNDIETPYDKEMHKIIDKLFVNGERQYLIGVDSLKTSTFAHELAHGLYYTDIEYANSMNEITRLIPKSTLRKFKKNLRTIGYCRDVMDDEIQAYMATEINKKITKGILNKKQIHEKYRKVFKKYKKDLGL